MSLTNKEEAEMENRLQKRDTRLIETDYIAGLHWNFAWQKKEIALVKKMWEEGAPAAEIIERLGCRGPELVILIMDLAEKGIIEDRPGAFMTGTKRTGQR